MAPRKKPSAPTVIVRKTETSVEGNLPVKYGVIEDYLSGDMTVIQIAEKYSMTPKSVDLVISRHWKTLRNIRETRMILAMPNGNVPTKENRQRYVVSDSVYKSLFSDDKVNGEFLQRITVADDPTLTTHELEFCYNWVYSTDEVEAIEKAGLAIGLYKPSTEDIKARFAYRKAVKMRGLWLRRKTNIASTIRSIQEETLKNAGVNKQFLQTELVREIDELREDKDLKARQLLSKNLEILGKTIPGAFSERIEIAKVDPSKALETLIDLAQASVKELPEGTEVDETWEMSEDDE